MSLADKLRNALAFDVHAAETASNTHEGRWLSDAGIAEVDGARKERIRTARIDAALVELVAAVELEAVACSIVVEEALEKLRAELEKGDL